MNSAQERKALGDVRLSYRILRGHTDPSGHDLLAAIEQAHLQQIRAFHAVAEKANVPLDELAPRRSVA